MDRQLRALIVESALLPVLIALSIRFSGVPKTQARLRLWAERRLVRSHDRPEQVIRQARIAQRAVQATFGIGGTCLTRSLTLWGLLKRRGVPVELQVGIRKLDGKIEGHAWIEYQGAPINDNPELISTYHAYREPLAFDAMFRSK